MHCLRTWALLQYRHKMNDKRKLSLLARFAFRWFVSSLGLWIAAGLLGDSIDYQSKLRVIIIAGLVLAIVNTIIKPVVVILSLPAILFRSQRSDLQDQAYAKYEKQAYPTDQKSLDFR